MVTRLPGRAPRRAGARAFTLIELLVVLAIIALLASLAMPRYFHGIEVAKQAALRHNLQALRETIDRFKADTGAYPDSLEQLVERHYLRAVPRDPLTESAGSWEIVPPEPPASGAVADVRSSAPGLDADGVAFHEW